jgi:[protein-PII] uridylyltransferase
MARHDLLSVLGLESLKEILAAPPSPPWGRIEAGVEDRPLKFSRELGDQCLRAFLSQESFLKSDPVLLGSWARGELSPGSDLDLLFLGPEEEVGKIVSWAQEKGLKIRSRLPQDFFDLSKGVELWDQLSLLDGRALTGRGRLILERERKKIVEAKPAEKKKWLRILKEERKSRHERHNSIQNLLEPNLKMGLGGMRDLQQGRLILKLDPSLAQEGEYANRLFDFYQTCFLWIRLLLQEEGQGDVIHSALQPHLATRLGFSDYRAFMSFVQKGLSRVSFYSDWLLAEAGLSAAQREKIRGMKMQTSAQMSQALLKDPSVLSQYEVRRHLDEVWPEASLPRRRSERGRELKRFFSDKAGDAHWIALFRSRLMDRLLPELKPLVGYVQHDQYHRYSADAHILQVVREVLRARKSSRHLSALAAVAKKLTKKDWTLLLWTALYHDLAKGRPEDHSDLGAAWVSRDLRAFGLAAGDVREVTWLVKHHLAFSSAALRRDPQDSRVLGELAKLDLTQGRIHRLLIFTAIDILGTNPASWNEWKAKLLSNLGEKLLAPERVEQVRLLRALDEIESDDQNRLLEIGREVGLKRLQSDLKKAKAEKSEAFEFYPVKKRLWVRYHHPENRKGALARVLGLFFQSGASVLQASVLTLPGLGIYDWFCLDFSGRVESLQKRLKLLAEQGSLTPPNVQWESVEIVQIQEQSWTLLFRGMDQRGLLWNAASNLFEAGLGIKSAQVQTWGEKAEDLFVVEPPQVKPSEWLAGFRERIGVHQK